MTNGAESMDTISASEIAGVAGAVEALRSGTISPDEFRRRRVVMGIYPIRGGPDRYLLRVRIPLGRVSPRHLRALAETADRYATGGGVHLTTRQDVHIYGVEMRCLPEALAFLAEAGLTTREACGDTVRNTVVCPFAGISQGEVFDVTPYAQTLGARLLRHPLGQRLPRKFKIAFEGCRGADHVGLPFQDMGVRAVVSPEGRPGFRIHVAGGLGALPQAGFPLEPFTPVSRLWPTVEALLRIFDRMGDRTNRGRARLKFVAGRLGSEAFRRLLFDERDSVESSEQERVLELPEPLLVGSTPEAGVDVLPSWPGALRQRQAGCVAVPVRIPLGDLSSGQLRSLAELTERVGAGVRITTAQGILLIDIPESDGERVSRALRDRGFHPQRTASIVRCAGTDTCTVGITRVRGLAALLEEKISSLETATRLRRPVTIKISGCPNGCGHHLVGEIGLRGVARNVNGRLAPHYMIHLGGGTREDGTALFGTPIGRVAARRVPEAVERLMALLDEEGEDGESARETFVRLGKDRCAAPLKDLLEESPERYREEDFFDLGVSSPEVFPAVSAGKAP
ncbi:MAG: nitrite/sulfite reductase [Deltaproteobacteria bacterium]|nr:nitrite/sulfite reductase [Deltaproteobacteria bacterium]